MRSPGQKLCNRVMRKKSQEPSKTGLSAFCGEMGYNELRMMPMPLLEEPITKEQFERELLSVPPKEADSRREFWTLCEALQAMEDTRCPPPDWFVFSFKKVLEHPSEERAEPWRELRHRLLEHMGEFQREPRAIRQRRNRFRAF